MVVPKVGQGRVELGRGTDVAFAVAIVIILAILFLPIPTPIIDLGLTLSIALSILILMVALWIDKPLQFSSFPTLLLIVTMLRLALNIASTRQILMHGSHGSDAAGYVIGGFSRLVMDGDFVIGVIVFLILVTVNFMVITKGATRMAEVGARFALDAVPGKQMAIDADLSSGLIDEAEARMRRRELEEESGFFGAMDGASKFVRGDAVAGLIITAVNIVGGIAVGMFRHNMTFADAADIYIKLAVGDGLVTQIPALVVSLAAGLLVSKGASRGSASENVLTQLWSQRRGLYVSSGLMVAFSLVPGLPVLPFLLMGGALAAAAYYLPRPTTSEVDDPAAATAAVTGASATRVDLQQALRAPEIELCLGQQVATTVLASQRELEHRVKNLRQRFAKQFGFIVPEIRISDELTLPPKSYEIRLHGTTAARSEMRIGELLVVVGEGKPPSVPHDETFDPAFGVRAAWVQEVHLDRLRRDGFIPVNNMSVLLTHVSEVIQGGLSQLLTYRDLRQMLDSLAPEYKKLVDEISPAQISISGIQSVLKNLLAERVSIRNLNLILEAIAEVVPYMRRTEQIAEHVRFRLGQQICGDLVDGGALKVLRLGNRWDLAFHQSLKRDGKGEIVEFDLDPVQIEQFGKEATPLIRKLIDQGHRFVLVTHPDARPFVRMIIDRIFPSIPVLSHVEIARGINLNTLGSVS